MQWVKEISTKNQETFLYGNKIKWFNHFIVLERKERNRYKDERF